MKKPLLLTLCFLFVMPCLTMAQQKPNIILINMDDMGWRDSGFMGSKFYETPVMDKLSKQGIVFTNGYASASNCAPSRASMLSGLWQTRHGIYTVGTSERGDSKNRKLVPIKNIEVLNPDFKIFPQLLKENGYSTCIAGKWHMSNNPLSYGFDVNIGGSHAGSPKSYYPPYGNVKIDGPNTEYLTDLITDKAIDYIKTQKSSKPFFLYYASYGVHSPIQKVDSLMHKFKGKPADDGQRNQAYATMLNNEDRNIGRVLQALETQGLMENTLIIFTSDNGGFNQVTWQHPLRAGKGSYFEGGTRVPLVFVWKGKIKAGTTSDLPVTNLDFYPTLMQVAGIKNYPKVDGNSVYNYLLTQKAEKLLVERPLYWYFPIYLEGGNAETNDRIFRTRPGETVRKGDWKLHRYFENDSVALYNLKTDIGEKNNVAKQNPQITKDLLALLTTWEQKVKAPAVTTLNKAYIPLNAKADQQK
ncbi:Arylsulfatase A [Pedobacter soli]|uniref:Arylsulfatase A n=2 Tax=Pedobacter soli TaxID=390242 RepID=A0A1G6XYN2_9SPHI|nr:Arylsulfatase A [Pedobacter soli]